MKKLFGTKGNGWVALIIRVTLGVVVFPHGAQKLLGLFGGNGFTGTMGFLTSTINLPWIIAFLVILIESIGSLSLIAGFATRFWALAMFGNFIGILVVAHINSGFFMNWHMDAGRPEGFEYHLLILGLSIASFISGGGKWSVDSKIAKETSKKGKRLY